jgi:glycosyltransferase involved in cell wall biosynthesis
MLTDREPYLSIVVCSSHGVQTFVTTTIEQCRRYLIPAELIVVAREEVALRPPERGPCAVRLIEVAAETGADLARQAGIGRARGRYVLTASADAPLADELLEFIGEQHARFSSVEWNDIAAKDGSLALGKGWYWKEMDGAKPFRWFKSDAEISVQPYSESARVLAIDIEPGPGVDTTTLDVLDHAESKILSVELARRSLVQLPLPDCNGAPVRLRLRVSGAGRGRSNDPRVLHARVLGCGLYESPVTARVWRVPARIWWMLTRSAGSSLLPERKCVEKWPDSPHVKALGEGAIGRRDPSFEEGAEVLKETLLEPAAEPNPRRRRRTAVDLLGLPLVFFFRSIPRPELPKAGAFAHLSAVREQWAPLRNAPKISVVTPSYQQGRFLEWTMRSVLEQGYENLEYVVMDGGSTDGTQEILARYRDRLAYCESAPDEGQADAVARGFEHTSGEIMAYLNSDDVLAPGALDFVARFLTEHPEVDAVYSHRVYIDEENIVTRYWILPPHHSWMMERWDYIPQETCFWRRRIYEQVGGIDKGFHFALDYDLFVRFMKHGRMERVNRFLGAFREHPSSKTTQQEGAHPEVARVYEEQGIRVADWHRLPQLAQHELLDVRSRRFAARGKILPGALAGVGYDYDLVWGGRLNGPRNFSRSRSGTRRI